MASPSSLMLPRNYKYKVFCSFHGPDVRKTLLSHIRTQFKSKAITMFDDQGIERGADIAPSLINAIRESRISIVILSKKYASSSWCLDELLEILECRKTMGQIVMTIFYGVDPSHVRKQIGDFGKAFDETCARKTEERQKWSQALNDVSNIAGEDFLNWKNEAIMIEKIAKDVLDKLNATPPRDFDNMVGLEAHLSEIQSLLDLNNDEVKMVGITGPAGIGKTTIARALYGLLSNRFQLSSFVNNLRESHQSGFDQYGLKLHLQEQFLSEILNQSGMRICDLGAIKEILGDQRVLIILDDVNNLTQLQALANDTTWFGPRSRIIVTTENKGLLRQHGINITHNVRLPSPENALKILCKYAFRQTSPCHGFGKLAQSVTRLCGYLPLGLQVVGSTLSGKKEDEWEDIVRELKTTVDRGIEDVLRVGYESLNDNEQKLFFHIAVFFNNKNVDLVKAMFEDSDLNVEYGLNILEMRSLIEISTDEECIVMHKLLRKVGEKAIENQQPWKRHILIDPDEICDVLERAKGTRVVLGISFDISKIDEVRIKQRAFERMSNLRFLRVHTSRYDGKSRMHISEQIEFPRRLRLLHWEAYPCKSLGSIINPEYLVELNMSNSQLETLWEGSQRFPNLKIMDLSHSKSIKEFPDLSYATKLESLDLRHCESLEQIPSSLSHLDKLEKLWLGGCINLASLEGIESKYSPKASDVAMLTMTLSMSARADINTCPELMIRSAIVPIVCFLRQQVLKDFKHLPRTVEFIDLQESGITEMPNCMKKFHKLTTLVLRGCRRLTSLPELPLSLMSLNAGDCESMETVFCPLKSPNAHFDFSNCLKFSQQTRSEMIQGSSLYSSFMLPGRIVPAEFDQQAKGNTLAVALDGNRSYNGLVFCVVISPHHNFTEYSHRPTLLCRPIGQSDLHSREMRLTDDLWYVPVSEEHLFIFRYSFEELYRSEVNREMMFEFSIDLGFDIIECAAMIWTQEESVEGSYESGSDQGNYESRSVQATDLQLT